MLLEISGIAILMSILGTIFLELFVSEAERDMFLHKSVYVLFGICLPLSLFQAFIASMLAYRDSLRTNPDTMIQAVATPDL